MSKTLNDKYTLPNGFTTNTSELKYLQQKLLKKVYENNINHGQLNKINNFKQAKVTQQSKINQKKLKEYERNHNILDQYDSRNKRQQKIMKQTLSNDLLSQIKQKQRKKIEQREIDKKVESKLLKDINKLDSLQIQKQKYFNKRYSQQAKQDLQQKQIKKSKEKASQNQQKQNYRNRFNSQSLINLRQYSYSNPIQQYCKQIQEAKNLRLQKNHIKQMLPNNSFKITINPEKMAKLNSLYNEGLKNSYNRQQSFFFQMKNRQQTQKQDLRAVLLKQIRQKQQAKLQQRKKIHQTPYSDSKYQSMHHPIYNPIDFKHAHDNQYILNQLKSVEK